MKHPVFPGSNWKKAGCDLLKRIGVCYDTPATSSIDCGGVPANANSKLPTMIIYSGEYRPDLGVPPYATAMTNRADKLFHLILDAINHRDTKS
jgi:hypothetical protein